MDKEEAIRQLNLTKQRVNQGSRAFRDQIDFNVLPLVADNAAVTGLVREARVIGTSTGRTTKAKLEEAKARILESSTEIHQLEKEYRYSNPAWFPPYGNVFAKCGLINKIEYSEEDFIEFIDWLAENNACNTIKMFLHGQWGRNTFKLVNLPHPYDSVKGTFDITKIDPKWWDTALRRLHELKKRKIRPVVINHYLVNAMHSHWLAQDMNDGWSGQKTYWDRDYGLWQWVHYAGKPPEVIPEYQRGEIGREEAEEWIRQYGACRDYFNWRDEFIYSELEREFGGWIIYHNNEVPAGGTWHGWDARKKGAHGIPKRRRITSTYLDFMTKGEVYSNYILDVHGIKSKEEYFSSVAYLLQHGVDVPIIASSDGKGYFWFKDAEQTQGEAEEEFRGLLIEIVTDKNMYWGNEWWYNPYDKVCDIGVLKKRLKIPNRILKEVLTIS